MNNDAKNATTVPDVTVPDVTVPGVDGLERATADLPRWWFNRARPDVIAAEIQLCAAPLAAEEVRTLVRPSADPSICLVSIVGPAGTNLLGTAAGKFAAEELLVNRAEMVTWESRDLELIRTTLIRPRTQADDAYWQHLATMLEWNSGDRSLLDVRFQPRQPVAVELTPAAGGTMVVVEAPHRVGLLWATCDWLVASGCVIREAQTESSGNIRQSAYLVRGAVDASALAGALSGVSEQHQLLTRPVRHAWRIGRQVLNRTPRAAGLSV